MRYLKIKYALLCSAIAILPLACSVDIPENSSEYLVAPVITSFVRQGDRIIIDFIGFNQEYYFDGYNVYVSDSSLNAEYVAKYKAVQVEGYASSEPSFPLGPEDYDPAKTRNITIYQYYWASDGEYIPYPLSTETTYYIFLCSHHRQGTVLPDGVSNQVVAEGIEE